MINESGKLFRFKGLLLNFTICSHQGVVNRGQVRENILYGEFIYH